MTELEPAGTPFSIAPARVTGEGNHRTLESTARTIYLACLRNIHVRSRSALLELEDEVLIDFEWHELARLDDQFDLDPGIFRATNHEAWVLTQSATPALRIPEAFYLVGPHTHAFGHWMWEYLPKYVEATLSSRMPCVPVLIDEGMPPSHRRALELLLPGGVEIIELPSQSRAVVDRLWYAPTPMHMPLLEKMNERFQWDFLASPPARFVRLIAEMNCRVDRHLDSGSKNEELIFLARKSATHRKLINRERIEAIASEQGFAIVSPEDLSFDEQVRLVRGARFIVGPEGSAMFLAFFSQPGARVCILNHPYTIGLAVLTGLLEEIGLGVRVFTGPYETENEQFPHFADYRLDPEAFAAFIAESIGEAAGPDGAR
jgi:hypothetical protein